MARGVTHGMEKKGAAIVSLLCGASCAATARALGLRETTVRTWKRELTDEEKKRIVENLIRERGGELDESIYAYLTASLRTMTAQAQVAGEKEFLMKQKPRQLAELHDVMAEGMLRMMELWGERRK